MIKMITTFKGKINGMKAIIEVTYSKNPKFKESKSLEIEMEQVMLYTYPTLGTGAEIQIK